MPCKIMTRHWKNHEFPRLWLRPEVYENLEQQLDEDGESGERVGKHVFVHRIPSIKDACYSEEFEASDDHYPQVMPSPRQHIRRHFRIKDSLRLLEVYEHSTKGPENFGKKRNHRFKSDSQNHSELPDSITNPFQSPVSAGYPGKSRNCYPLHGNDAYSSTRRTCCPSPGCSAYSHRKSGDYDKANDEVVIQIWEEFRYGSSILNSRSLQPMGHGGCEILRPLLGWIFPESMMDSILGILFFAFYFISCCMYNDFVELGGYLMYDLHLRVHEKSYENDVKVKFAGSPFEGPMYCIIRFMCKHCQHYEDCKVVSRLMPKMKDDIVRQ